MFHMREDNIQVVFDYIKKNNKETLNPKKISEKVDLTYPVVLRACDILEARELIKVEWIGNAKVVQVS